MKCTANLRCLGLSVLPTPQCPLTAANPNEVGCYLSLSQPLIHQRRHVPPAGTEESTSFILDRLPRAERVSHLCLSEQPAHQSNRDRQKRRGRHGAQRVHADNIHCK